MSRIHAIIYSNYVQAQTTWVNLKKKKRKNTKLAMLSVQLTNSNNSRWQGSGTDLCSWGCLSLGSVRWQSVRGAWTRWRFRGRQALCGPCGGSRSRSRCGYCLRSCSLLRHEWSWKSGRHRWRQLGRRHLGSRTWCLCGRRSWRWTQDRQQTNRIKDQRISVAY